MRRLRNRSRWAAEVTAALLAVETIVTSADCAPVTGWQLVDGPPTICVTCFDFGTNHPTVGNGTMNSAADVGIYAAPSNLHLDLGQEAVLSGRVRIIGGSAAAREFRFGLWKKVPNGTPATRSWLGYMALNASGPDVGRLEVRNPDDPGFATQNPFSDQGGNLAPFSGPAPESGSPLDNPPTPGTGAGRYFLLAEDAADDNALWTSGRWYNFELRVGRISADEIAVRASLISDPLMPTGDFNDDGTVNAADYTVWRDQLGSGFMLSNEGGVTPGMVTPEDYDSWKNAFGNVSTVPYRWQVEALDVDGNPPPQVVDGVPSAYTSHLTFEFDRVGFFLGNSLGADLGEFQDIDLSVDIVQGLRLEVDATGAASIVNRLPEAFAINYYEIASATGSLVKAAWTSIDSTEGGDPIGSDWDEAGGSSDSILSEANLTGAQVLNQNDAINLGNIFDAVGGTQDLRFYFGLTDGTSRRGVVTYASVGSGAAVPEPGSLWLFLVGLGAMGVRSRSGEGDSH
jgi:hypothetical protein